MTLYPYGRTGNEVTKRWSNKDTKCDSCGKYCRGMYWTYTNYFKTLDGGDYLWSDECYMCRFKGHIYSIKSAIKRKFKKIKTTYELWALMKSYSWHDIKRIKLALKVARSLNY